MLSTQLKAFLFAAGGTAAVATTAYVSGVLDRFLVDPPVAVAALPSEPAQPKADLKTDRMQPSTPAPRAEAPAEQEIIAPSFDVVRVEPDGSIVIAGKAAPNASVEILTGSKILGRTKAGKEGDFAVVLDEPLAPGGYQIVLRSTTEANVIAMSPETAVVSIPEREDGQVLALVEQPGQPSKLITVPEPTAPAADAKPAETKPAEAKPAQAAQPQPAPAEAAQAPAADKPAAPAVAATPQPEAPQAETPKPAEAPAVAAVDPAAKPAAPAATPAPAIEPTVKVEAVEIEGNKVFVAGVAKPGSLVRVYANNVMLGEAKASEGGRFLVEALRDLPVGGYIIRADLLAPDGIKVIARAEVPFEREAGQSVAAVAPPTPAPAKPAAPATEPAKPAVTAEAPKPTEPAAAPAVAVAPPSAPAEVKVALAEPPAVAVPDSGMKLAAEPPAITAPMLQSVDGAVIIRRGDTLWRISRRVYGMGVRYSTIYLANQDQIADPDRIWPGQVFTVPEKTGEGETADMKAIADQTAPADAKTASAKR